MAVEPSRLLQGRRRSRAAAIQEAQEEPRPQCEGDQEGGPVGDLSEPWSPLSGLPLSPLSSMGLDLSAEPLSPTTTAALQILRERGFPQNADSAGLPAADAGDAPDSMNADCYPSRAEETELASHACRKPDDGVHREMLVQRSAQWQAAVL